jgi:hypothetical protein
MITKYGKKKKTWNKWEDFCYYLSSNAPKNNNINNKCFQACYCHEQLSTNFPHYMERKWTNHISFLFRKKDTCVTLAHWMDGSRQFIFPYYAHVPSLSSLSTPFLHLSTILQFRSYTCDSCWWPKCEQDPNNRARL